MNEEEIKLAEEVINMYGYHNNMEYLSDLGRDKFLIKFHNVTLALVDFYYFVGKAYFRRQVPKHGIMQELGINDDSFEMSFLNLYTAASLGHK